MSAKGPVFPVAFDELAIAEDLARLGEAGAEALGERRPTSAFTVESDAPTIFGSFHTAVGAAVELRILQLVLPTVSRHH